MTNHLQQIKTQQDKLFSLEKKIEEITIKRQQLLDKEKETTYSRDLFEERMALGVELKKLQDETTHQKNKVFCLENEGKLTSISDKKGQTYIDVPDFREVNSNQITFEEDEILTAKQPPYIPYIDEDSFRQRGYIFDAIRLKEDSYLMAIKKHEEKIASFYTIVTLGQLVLIIDFYTTKAKAKLKKDAQDKNERQEKYWDNLSEEKRSRFLMQQGIYHSLPAKIKKELSNEDYEALDWQEREKIYKFYKRYGSKRITSVLGSKQMWTSFHQMYERFINPNATPPKPGYGNTEVFAYWYEFVDVINYKLNDIEIQRADLSEARKSAIETSFGESNTSDVLQKKYGILVKRQNGDKINPMEVGQIENAFVTVQKKFGNLKEICLKKNIKISHTGVKYVFASKAVGMYVPDMGTIAVSDKFGDTQFKLTMAHELAHFIDNYIGELNEKRYATDNYESTAGKIAFEFRKNMNIPSSKQSKYTNATKECFARALEMYVGVETFGENTGVHYSDGVGVISEMKPFFASGNFVSKESYTNTIKPLIEQFFKENKDIFTYTVDIDQSEEPVPMGTETSSTDIKEINEAIAALELLFELENDELIKQNIEGTIDELRFSYLGGVDNYKPILEKDVFPQIVTKKEFSFDDVDFFKINTEEAQELQERISYLEWDADYEITNAIEEIGKDEKFKKIYNIIEKIQEETKGNTYNFILKLNKNEAYQKIRSELSEDHYLPEAIDHHLELYKKIIAEIKEKYPHAIKIQDPNQIRLFEKGGIIAAPEFTAQSDYYFEYIPLEEIEKYKEFDREVTIRFNKSELDDLTEYIGKNGITSPITLQVYNGYGLITEGNHRIAAAKRLGIKNIPTRIIQRNRPFKGTIYESKVVKLPRKIDSSELKVFYPEVPLLNIDESPAYYGFTKTK